MNTELNADLDRAVRTTGHLRTGFYVVVLLIALGGQVSGAMEALDMPWEIALPAVGALELGGIVVLGNADVRRRLGENVLLGRLLSAAIALGAVAFNWLAHANHLEGGFYGGMSLLGYLIYLMNSANKRRDRLRANGQMEATAPLYGTWQWLTHPGLTRRARALALTNAETRLGEGPNPTTAVLGKLASLAAAREQVRAERREAGLAKAVRELVAAGAGKDMAGIAVDTYDMDEIARRLADRADYDGLTTLLAGRLTADKLAGVVSGKAPLPDDITAVADAVSTGVEQEGDTVTGDSVSLTRLVSRATPARHPRLARPRRMAARGLPPIHVTVVAPERPRRDTTRDTVSPRKATGAAKTTAERVAEAVAKNPSVTADILASRLKVSTRTVQRHMPRVNGSEVTSS